MAATAVSTALERPPPDERHVWNSSYLRAFIASSVLFMNLLPIPNRDTLMVALSVVGCAWVITDLLTGQRKVGAPHLILLVMAVILGFGGLFHPPATQYGQEKFNAIITAGLATGAVMILLRNHRDFRAFAWMILFFAVIVAVAALAQPNVAGPTASRGQAFQANPIWSARGVVSGIVAATWLLIWGARSRLILVLALGVCGLGMLDLESRFAVVAVAAAIAALAFSSRMSQSASEFGQQIRAWRPLPVVLTVVATGIPVLIFLGGPRILSFLTNPSESISGEARTVLWPEAWHMFQNNPGGIGVGNFSLTGYIPYPHNFYLEALLEFGVVFGGAILVLIAITVVKSLLNRYGTSSMALACGLVVASAVGVGFSGDMNSRNLYATIVLVWSAGMIRPSPPAPSTDDRKRS